MSNFRERITMDPAICHGQPTVRGLRYPVQMILELLSAGMTPDELVSGPSRWRGPESPTQPGTVGRAT